MLVWALEPYGAGTGGQELVAESCLDLHAMAYGGHRICPCLHGQPPVPLKF